MCCSLGPGSGYLDVLPMFANRNFSIQGCCCCAILWLALGIDLLALKVPPNSETEFFIMG